MPEASDLPGAEGTYRSSEVYECPICRDSGYQLIEEDGVEFARPCDCRRVKRARLARAHLPKIFQGIDTETFRPRPGQQAAFERIQSNPSGSFFLWGETGLGKSHMLAYQYLLRSQCSVLFRSTAELLAEVQEQEFQEDYVAPVFCKFHLFWDDIHEFAHTEFRELAVYRVIDHYSRNQIPISITSNMGLKQLVGEIGAHVVRRIDDMCEVIEL